MELLFDPSDFELDAVVERTIRNEGFALVVGGSSAWNVLRAETRAGKITLDLREVAEPYAEVARIARRRPDFVALHDSPELAPREFRALIENLYEDHRPVVFHTESHERLAELLRPIMTDSNRILGGGVRNWDERPPTPWPSTGSPMMFEAREVTAERERSVNSLVVLPGREEPVARLETRTAYEVLLDIGPRRAGSLLPEADAVWPDERLPDGDLELRAVLTMAGAEPAIIPFTLPAEGPSERVRFPVTTPVTPQVWTAELVIYYQVVPVHSQQLIMPVGLDESPHALLLGRLTRDFADLGPLSDRTASVSVSPGGGRALVNGVTDNPASISPDAATGVARSARQHLYDMHLTNKLDKNFGKTAAAFEADLAILARLGWQVFTALFKDNTYFDTLPDLIRMEARARQRPPVLNVSDPSVTDPNRDPPLPWSLIYDQYIEPIGEYRVCESLREFGPGGSGAPVPVACPYEHTGSTLCPFGFWGLSCVIEQPHSTGRLTWTVLDGRQPPALAMFVDPGLDEPLTREHRRKLKERLPAGTVTDLAITSKADLATQLADETMDVAYLYCHGGYSQLSTEDRPTNTLQFGQSKLHPSDIDGWRATFWRRPHWPHRKPLVLLNGCHTVEETTATLNNFVDAFTNRAEAAGVIGTEVTIEQGLAGWAMEELLHNLFAGGASVGEALRDLRWRMINRGNVMGLAYTLYCVAGLRLRPPA